MRSSAAMLLALVLLLTRGARLEATESTSPEQAIKAAYLYNFALYTEWPVPPVDTVGICIAGQDAFGSAFDAIAGKTLRGKPVVVRRLYSGTDFTGCHVLYIGTLVPGQRARLAGILGQQPLLSVAEAGDGDDFRPIILLVPDRKRIAFEIDHTLAKAVGLVLSSQLLRLAQVVH